MKKFFLLLCFLTAACWQGPRPLIKIGVDSSWRDVELYKQERNVNAFLDEFLLDICKQKKVRIELIKVNSFQLLEGLKKGEYDAALSVLYPFDFNLDKYAFSPVVLLTGSVLVLRKGEELKDFTDKLIGVIHEEDTNLLIQHYPEAMYKEYFSAPDLLDAVKVSFLDGGILESLEAIPYVKNLYSSLTIARPLSDFGIRFVSLKNNKKVLKLFKKALKDKKDLDKLKTKWDLLYQN